MYTILVDLKLFFYYIKLKFLTKKNYIVFIRNFIRAILTENQRLRGRMIEQVLIKLNFCNYAHGFCSKIIFDYMKLKILISGCLDLNFFKIRAILTENHRDHWR
jgi:hypothetical protein